MTTHVDFDVRTVAVIYRALEIAAEYERHIAVHEKKNGKYHGKRRDEYMAVRGVVRQLFPEPGPFDY